MKWFPVFPVALRPVEQKLYDVAKHKQGNKNSYEQQMITEGMFFEYGNTTWSGNRCEF